MSSREQLLIDRSDRVLRLSLDRPQRANALGPDLVEALIAAFIDLGDAQLVVLSGQGKSFCSGFDLSDIDDISDGDLLWRFVRIERLLQLVHHAPVMVLALAHRYAYGAGADLFACASARIIAPNTALRMPGLNFDLVLGTRRLSSLIGPDAARDVLIDTRMVDADEAIALGLAHDIVETERWPDVVAEMQQRASLLSPRATMQMLEATRSDTRDSDMAALVASASEPGLRDRVKLYIDQASQKRKAS